MKQSALFLKTQRIETQNMEHKFGENLKNVLWQPLYALSSSLRSEGSLFLKLTFAHQSRVKTILCYFHTTSAVEERLLHPVQFEHFSNLQRKYLNTYFNREKDVDTS